MEDYKTYRVLLSGRVQGVGFRYFAEDKAQTHNINGYVQNTMDNKVEVVCQGKSKDLELFIIALRKGPAFANVTDFRLESLQNPQQYSSFAVKY